MAPRDREMLLEEVALLRSALKELVDAVHYPTAARTFITTAVETALHRLHGGPASVVK